MTLEILHPFPRVRVFDRDVNAIIQSEIEHKHWSHFVQQSRALYFYPFYFVEYQAFREQDVTGKGKIVTESKRSYTAFNALTLELEAQYASDFAGELGKELPDSLEPHMSEFPHSLEDVKSMLVVKLSQFLLLPKENILLLHIQSTYLPIWVVQASIGSSVIDLEINAINRNVVNSQEIPLREKDWLELTQEVLDELKEPKTWVSYTKAVLPKTRSLTSSIQSLVLENTNFQLFILGVLLIIVLVLAFQVK